MKYMIASYIDDTLWVEIDEPSERRTTIEVPDELADAYTAVVEEFERLQEAIAEYHSAVLRDNRPEPEAARYWAQLERGRRKHYRRARPTTEGDTK